MRLWGPNNGLREIVVVSGVGMCPLTSTSSWTSHSSVPGSPNLSATDPRQVWQFLGHDGAIVERGLTVLRDDIGRQHGHQHWQRMNDLTSQLKGQQRCGDGVGHRPREGSSTCRDRTVLSDSSQGPGSHRRQGEFSMTVARGRTVRRAYTQNC